MWRKKTIVIILVAIALLFVGGNQEATAGKYGFLLKIFKQSKGAIKTLAKDAANSVNKPLKSSQLKKMLPKLPAHKITPDTKAIAALGKNFTNQGKYATKFINSVSKPGDVLRQFSKYGPGYVKTTQNATKALSKNIDSLISVSKNIGYKKLSPALSSSNLALLKNPGVLNSKLVEVLKHTGKKGYKALTELANWAKKNPKTAAGAAALAWYLGDPEGFTDAVRQSGKTVSEFATQTFSAAGEGVGRGVTTGISSSINMSNILYILIGTVIFLIFILRPVRRFVLIPFKIIGHNMNKLANKFESTDVQRPMKREYNHKPKIESAEDLTHKGSSIFE